MLSGTVIVLANQDSPDFRKNKADIGGMNKGSAHRRILNRSAEFD